MSRGDNYDDPYEREDGYDDVGEPRRRPSSRLIEAARARVGVPATLLQVLGAIIIAWFTMMGVLSLISPDTIVDIQFGWIEKIQQKQPPEQRQPLPPRAQAIKDQQIQGPIYSFLWVGAGLLMFVGGMKMKQLRGYGWAIAGSIAGIFPGMCCCCTGLVPGIWGLVVLLNSDVKEAFNRQSGADPSIAMPMNEPDDRPRGWRTSRYDRDERGRSDDERTDYDDRPPPAAYRRDPRDIVQGPGWAMSIIGWSGLALTAITVAILAIVGTSDKSMPRELYYFRAVVVAVFGLVALVMFAVIAVAGGYMRRCQRYGLCMAGAILLIATIVVFSPCGLLAGGFGIWALVVLCDRGVRDAFDRVRPPRTRVVDGGWEGRP